MHTGDVGSNNSSLLHRFHPVALWVGEGTAIPFAFWVVLSYLNFWFPRGFLAPDQSIPTYFSNTANSLSVAGLSDARWLFYQSQA